MGLCLEGARSYRSRSQLGVKVLTGFFFPLKFLDLQITFKMFRERNSVFIILAMIILITVIALYGLKGYNSFISFG